ncbi:MAG: DUF4150 domain-containing protein [Isosphaeraceae bacterium]
MPVTVKVNGTSLSLVHKGSNGVSTATVPDVCKTPAPPGPPVPIPYPNVSMSSDLIQGTTTVTADGGNMIAVKGSQFMKSTGDEAGVAGGVKSSTFIKESTWILYSFDVKMDGNNACRLTDKKFHNHENTVNAGGEIQTALGLSDAEFKETCKNCKENAQNEIESSQAMQAAYKKAGTDPKNKTGDDVEKAVAKHFADMGIELEVQGTTDTDGNVNVVDKAPDDPCAKVSKAATTAHENVHKATQQKLEKKYGKGTAKFEKAWNDGPGWAQDEVNAYAADQKFNKKFIGECNKAGA